jgi:hypothetical protein
MRDIWNGQRGGEKKTYEATITDDGDLVVDDRLFSAPSSAALPCIQQAGSDRSATHSK